jgi:hypothetical protein
MVFTRYVDRLAKILLHVGEIKVETKEGKGAEFRIQLLL